MPSANTMQCCNRTPNNIAALAQKGSALKTLGRQDESIQCLRRCMELDRSFGEAAWSLSNLKTYRFSDDEVVTIIEGCWPVRI